MPKSVTKKTFYLYSQRVAYDPYTKPVLYSRIRSKFLGVTLDSHLTMDSKVSDIFRSAFYTTSVPCDIYGLPSRTT